MTITGTKAYLAELLAQMHGHIEEAAWAAQASEATTGDPQAALVTMLLQATTALARVGQADQACRLAASAWAALREPRPDLAVRVTGALHGLARRLDGKAAQTCSPRDSREKTAGAAAAADRLLDVRNLVILTSRVV